MNLNLIEMLLWDLKSAARKWSYELKQPCKEKFPKIPQWCDKLLKSHRKCLLQVTAAKGSSKSSFSYDFALRISLTKQTLLSAKSKEITDKQIIYKDILIM